jgi:hypothetical protein
VRGQRPEGHPDSVGGSPGARSDGDEETDTDAQTSESSAWSAFELGGLHPVVGVTLAPGVAGFVPFSGELRGEVAGLFAVRGGLLVDRTAIVAELAPATWIWDPDPRRFTVTFSLAASHLFRLLDNLYWPIGGGLGVAANDIPITSAYFHVHLDVIGLVYQYGHLLFEVVLPSIRFDSDLQRNAIVGFMFCFSVSYVL